MLSDHQSCGPESGGKKSVSPHDHVQQQHEPIAVIGMACRLPGNCSSTSALWDSLSAGRSGHGDVPQSRYNASAFYHPDADRPGSINSTKGYFIQEDIRHFENAFFGINNLDAMTMDPQQRKLLEVAYECLESAGLTLDSVAGKNVGCYVGNFALDHMVMQLQDPEYVSRYTAIGATPNILANRISHAFNLKGPSFVLDTACSSSLYSLHYACCALDLGECDTALVASANLIQSPQHQMIATKAGILSSAGSCRTFDEDADGYGRAEGVGALVLKKLSQAVKDGDPVRAVIRGTAVNSNGRTNGIMLPDSTGQHAVMLKAYLRAGLQTDQTDYVEAHGTGTAVGDPIEVEAISRTFSHRAGRPTMIGSVKTNLGHSEATSGISSVIKVILALENGMIPPTIGIRKLNPKVTSRQNVTVVQSLTPWPQSHCPRASINSFGFGGANSHVIVESAGLSSWKSKLTSMSRLEKRMILLPISAASAASLRRRLEDVKQFIEQPGLDLSLGCLAYTLSERSNRFQKRGYVIIDERARDGMHLVRKEAMLEKVQAQDHRAIAFLFTGQGAQWQGMALELYLGFEAFRTSIHELNLSLKCSSASPGDLASLLLGREQTGSQGIDDPWVAQVLTTAIQIAIVDLLHHLKIVPSAVIGHSSGEIAASYSAGLLTKSEAILCSNARGRSICDGLTSLPPGEMLAVGLDKEAASSLLEQLGIGAQVCIACVNSSANVTVSGDKVAIQRLQKALDSDSIFNRLLKTNGIAYHSYHMRSSVGPKYRMLLDELLRTHPLDLSESPQINMISTVNNRVLNAQDVKSARYWQENLENTVQFEAAVQALLQQGSYQVIEVGPHCALKSIFNDILQGSDSGASANSSVYNSVLVRNLNAQQTLLELLGGLYSAGVDFCLDRANQIESSERHVETRLPPYPWDYSRGLLWREPRAIAELRRRQYQRHELLGSLITGGNGSTLLWRNVFSIDDAKWVQDHRFGPTVLFPAAGFLSMAMEATCQAYGLRPSTCTGLTLRDIRFFKALPLDSSPVELLTELKRLQISTAESSSHWWQFSIGSLQQESFTAHMGGMIKMNDQLQEISLAPLSLDHESFEEREPRAWFKRMQSIGLNLGPAFMTFQKIWVDRCRTLPEAMAEIRFGRGSSAQATGEHEYIVHPTTLDALLQSAFIAAAAGEVRRADPWIPVAVDELRVAAPGSIDMSALKPWRTLSMAKETGFGTIVGNSDLKNSRNETLIQMRNARAVTYQGSQKADGISEQARFPMLRVCWKPEVLKADKMTSKAVELHAKRLSQLFFSNSDFRNPGNIEIAAFLDLVCHQQPNSRILSIGPEIDFEAISTTVLDGKSAYRRFSSWNHILLGQHGEVLSEESVLENDFAPAMPSSWPEQYQHFDIIVAISPLPDSCARIVLAHTKSETKIFASSSPSLMDAAQTKSRFITSLQVCPGTPSFLFISESSDVRGNGRRVFLITASLQSACLKLDTALEDQLIASGFEVTVIAFEHVEADTLSPDALVISTVGLNDDILMGLRQDQMTRLQSMTNMARRILFISNGHIIEGRRPNSVLMLGAARAIMLEQPSLKIATFDIDETTDESLTATQAVGLLDRIANNDGIDLEYAQHSGAIHISRWVPADALNHRFEMKQSARSESLLLHQPENFQIGIERAGQFDTIRFHESERQSTLGADQVEVEASCYGMNAKDIYLLNAKFDTPDATTSCEMSGTAVRIGTNVSNVKIGDRVVVMAPGKYEKLQVIPEWACHRLEPEESFEDACTLPVVFSTALYALKYKAQVEEGEAILIHSATGGLGLASMQVARLLGAEIFVTAGTEQKRRYLIEECGIPSNHVFNSRNGSFLPALLGVTSGRGVDVVINSLTGDLLHSSVATLAPFGRFIELGKKDILENGRLEMSAFSHNLSFTSIDLMDFYYSERKQHHQFWQRLLSEIFSMLRKGHIHAIRPSAKFEISQVCQAVRHFSQPSRMGKVVVSLQDQQSPVKVVRTRFDSKFDPHKTYLMIGCFGGIGRSITRWMLSQGAKSFVFMSRSGLTRPAARELISDLEKHGATTHVLVSDVSKADDVERSIRSAPSPIGGVVQASMAVKATNWESLSRDQWHHGIEAKTRGTWNLHHSLSSDLGSSLDFFLLVSSVSGTIGSPTEPSYCAANAFMDNFARFRRQNGLPGISLGLGVINDVGYLHEHPEMEAVFTRRGFQGISEDEMLQMIDMAIHSDIHADQDSHSSDPLMQSHILTGLELQQAKAHAKKHGSATIEVLFQDPRASILAASYARDVGQNSTSSSRAESTSTLPTELRETVQEGKTLAEAIGISLSRKFSEIIMLPEEQLEMDAPVIGFGLDSMLAAEFRGFVFQQMGIDLPFMTLLSNKTSIRSLSEDLASKLSTVGEVSGNAPQKADSKA